MPPVTIDALVAQLDALGVEPGGVLLAHVAFSRVGPVEGGPQGFIIALTRALGKAGTLVMPSMSDDDEVPFDPARSACTAMGIVPEIFWRMPGVLRSNSPHAFAAIGPRAAEITAPHPFDVPHGVDSPVGRVEVLDGQVLLAGVGHDGNTTIHLAEELAGVRYRLEKHLTLLRDGSPIRLGYREIDHCCQGFEQLDEWLSEVGGLRTGSLGRGPARLMRARQIIATAVPRLRAEETIFLHPAGTCGECDDARSSIPGA